MYRNLHNLYCDVINFLEANNFTLPSHVEINSDIYLQWRIYDFYPEDKFDAFELHISIDSNGNINGNVRDFPLYQEPYQLKVIEFNFFEFKNLLAQNH